jgi:hypothetical protein
VRSLLKQGEWLPWEAVLVGDTHAGPPDFRDQLPLARALAAQHPERLRYVEHDGGLHMVGHPQRNHGATVARGRWLAWLGDDDIYLPGAFETLGRVLRRQEDDPRVLLFRWIAPWKTVLWQEAGVLLEGYVDAEMIVCPNVPSRLGTWNTARYQGDFDFIKETSDHWNGPERVLWQPEVIAQAQPSEAEDWTLGGREAAPVAVEQVA